MSEALIYVLITLCAWVGIGFLLAAVFRFVDSFGFPEGEMRQRVLGNAGKAAGIGAVLMVLSIIIPRAPLPKAEPGLTLPIFWTIAPFTWWMSGVCFFFGLLGLLKLAVSYQPDLKVDPERKMAGKRIIAGVVWLAFGTLFAFFFKSSGDTITVQKGAIPFSPGFAVTAAGLLIAAFILMAIAGRAARVRGLTKTAASHLALVIGSIVFGLPFAWALITSFKEDRDMSAANGLVWIPRVQQTVPFRDPTNPLYKGNYEGEQVLANLIKKTNDGKLQLDIDRPAVLRGHTFIVDPSQVTEVDREAPLVTGKYQGKDIKGKILKELEDGKREVSIMEPAELKDVKYSVSPTEVEPVRNIGLRYQNYSEALEYLPTEAKHGLVYLKNSVYIVILSIIGTLLSSSVVAYAFARLKFPLKNVLFTILLSTMMLPAAVTLMPQFLIFRTLGWIDTLNPIWVPSFFAGAFNVFMLRQFFMQVPMELEDAAKIDGCTYLKSFWSIMLPMVKPALAVIAIWTFMGQWNNFLGPLIYVNSPEHMPISYALQLFQGERFGEPGLLMAFSVLSMMPVLLVFFFAQRYFIEGVSLSGLGGR